MSRTAWLSLTRTHYCTPQKAADAAAAKKAADAKAAKAAADKKAAEAKARWCGAIHCVERIA